MTLFLASSESGGCKKKQSGINTKERPFTKAEAVNFVSIVQVNDDTINKYKRTNKKSSF